MRRDPTRSALLFRFAAAETRAMMIKRFLTTFATVALGSVAVQSLALAQGYPAGSSSGYSIPADPSYPPGGYPAAASAGARGDAPDFDALDDEEVPQNGRPATALSAPGLSQGPITSADDPRYGRPSGAPVYSDRMAPQGPV